MADRPQVLTQLVSRDKLAAVFKSQEMIKAFENLTRDVSTTLPDASAGNSSAIETAQATANAAAALATTANGNAATAQAGVAALNAVPFVTISVSPTVANERALAISSDLTLVDGGAGGSVTLGLNQLNVILGADVSDSTAAFVNATGFTLPLAINATYLVDGLITFQSAAVTTGIGLGFTLPAGAAISGGYSHNTTATAIEGSYNNASGAVKGNTSGVLTALDNVPIIGRWAITTGATAGNAQLQFRSEVAASAVTLKAALSVLVARRIA